MGLLRRTLVFAILILSLIGIPLPAHAASGEESPPLTFNGRPLSELLHGRATGAPFPLPALLQQGDGQISGVVVDASGQPVADQRVELRRPSSEGPLRLVATTDTNGQFVYGGLGPGRYEIELRDETRVLATSGPIELSEEAMRVSGVTVARPAPPQRRRRYGSADQLLGGQSVMESFDAVQSILDPGHEIIVRDEEGRATRGRVVSISANQLVIERPRFFFRREELAFTEGFVQKIEIVDSPANGTLLGAAPGFAFALVGCRGEWAAACWFFATGIFIGPGVLLGQAIDNSINAPIYERTSQTRRVTIAPVLGRGRKGVLAQVRF